MTAPRPKHAPFGSISLNKDAGPPSWATSKSTGAIPTTTKPFPSPTDNKDKFMRGHRSTFSNTVNSLLQRGISQSKDTKHGHQHTMSADKISGPVFMRSDEPLSQRSGPLGSGATVVRTPNEALKDSGIRLEHSREGSLPRIQQNDHEEDEEMAAGPSQSPAVPSSPPLPPLPAFDGPDDYLEEESDDEGDRISQNSEPMPQSSTPISMNMSSLARAVTSTPPLRPSLKVRSMPITAEDFPPVPPLPVRVNSVPPTPLQPNFNAIVTAGASGFIDPSNLIIALETSTQTYRTTYATLTSRPSLLSEYIATLCSQSAPRSAQDPDTSSFYSTDEPSEDYIDAYRHHLASQGLLSPTKSMKKASPSTLSQISIFLDRPSSPYALILDYLRSPLPAMPASSLYTTAALSDPLPPRAHQIPIDALLEVRDEAAYLGLQSLRDLIVEELKIRNTLNGPRHHTSALHHRRGRSTGGNNSSGVASLHASVYSSHSSSTPALVDTNSKGGGRSGTNTPFSEASTLNNAPESESPMQYHCGGADSKHTSSTSLAPPLPPLPVPFVQRSVRTPPAPQSWVTNESDSRSESRTRNRSRDPPAGWI